MPISPHLVVYPASKIRSVVRVIHDGTVNQPEEFSLAEIEFHDATTGFGIRSNMNYWNEDNPDLGYPTCRPGNPTWYLLPDLKDLHAILTQFLTPENVL